MGAQQDLVDRVVDDLAADPRVRGLWLTGSFGAGTADEYSDVDMFVLVAEAHVDGYASEWLGRVAPRYRPLLVRRRGPGAVFEHLLPGWLRWDVVVGGPAGLNDLDPDRVLELLNRDSVHPRPSFRAGVEAGTVRELTEEFLRVLGMLPLVVGRGELVTAVTGASLLRQLLTTLLRYRAEGPRLSGALRLNEVLPPDEVAALAALPPVYADRGAVVRAHLSCAAMFLPVARDLLGPDHPRELEAACWEHLRLHLGVDPLG